MTTLGDPTTLKRTPMFCANASCRTSSAPLGPNPTPGSARGPSSSSPSLQACQSQRPQSHIFTRRGPRCLARDAGLKPPAPAAQKQPAWQPLSSAHAEPSGLSKFDVFGHCLLPLAQLLLLFLESRFGALAHPLSVGVHSHYSCSSESARRTDFPAQGPDAVCQCGAPHGPAQYSAISPFRVSASGRTPR